MDEIKGRTKDLMMMDDDGYPDNLSKYGMIGEMALETAKDLNKVLTEGNTLADIKPPNNGLIPNNSPPAPTTQKTEEKNIDIVDVLNYITDRMPLSNKQILEIIQTLSS